MTKGNFLWSPENHFLSRCDFHSLRDGISHENEWGLGVKISRMVLPFPPPLFLNEQKLMLKAFYFFRKLDHRSWVKFCLLYSREAVPLLLNGLLIWLRQAGFDPKCLGLLLKWMSIHRMKFTGYDLCSTHTNKSWCQMSRCLMLTLLSIMKCSLNITRYLILMN